MTQTDVSPTTGRRIGYGIAIVINLVVLVIVHNVLEWGWFSWLTDDFTEVVPILSLSIVATMIVNVVYLAYDAPWFKALCEAGLLVISIMVAVRMWSVFPFDFSAYSWDWEATTRMIIACAIIGMSIALVVNIVRFFIELARFAERSASAH